MSTFAQCGHFAYLFYFRIRSGVTQSTVNNIVSGRNNSTTVSTIQKLCDGLGITIIDFFQSELFLDLEQEIK